MALVGQGALAPQGWPPRPPVAFKTKVAAADVHGDIELPDKADASSLD